MDISIKHESKDKQSQQKNKKKMFTIVLVSTDCLLIALQPILVHLTKNDLGGFEYHPVSVNFITEAVKVLFASAFLVHQVSGLIFFLFSRASFYVYDLSDAQIISIE